MLKTIKVDVEGEGTFYVSVAAARSIANLASEMEILVAHADPLSTAMAPVYLVGNGNRRIAVIKEIRKITGFNLRDAKALSDKAMQHPVLLGRYRGREAQEIIRDFEEAGATVEIRHSALELLAQLGE